MKHTSSTYQHILTNVYIYIVHIFVFFDINILNSMYVHGETLVLQLLSAPKVPPLPSMVQTPAVASAPRAITPPAASALLPMRRGSKGGSRSQKTNIDEHSDL